MPAVISDLLCSICLDNNPLNWRLGQIGEGDLGPQGPSSLYRTCTLSSTLPLTLPFSGSLPGTQSGKEQAYWLEPLWASLRIWITSYVSAFHPPSVSWMFCLLLSLLLYFFVRLKRYIYCSFGRVLVGEVMPACSLSAMFNSKFSFFRQGAI